MNTPQQEPYKLTAGSLDEHGLTKGGVVNLDEVRALREQLAVREGELRWAGGVGAKYLELLTAVLDAGRPHSHYCMCDCCNAWLAVRKELRGE